MSSKIVVLLVLVPYLCMQMYACNAGRVLVGFSVEKNASHNPDDSVNEDVEKVLANLSETTSMPSSTRGPSKSVEVKNPETVVIHEKADLSRKEGESTKPTSSGHGVTLSTSSQIDQRYQIELKGSKRQARSVLGSATQDNDSEEDHITDSEGSSNEAAIDEEDVGVMDYANPHRKPPIHNEKP